MNWPADSLVLIVDDEESIRNGLARLFRSVHLPAETFASAGTYLAHPVHAGPTCLILDVKMPGLSGLELQRALLSRELQIIFLTGYGDVPTCAEAMKAGAIDFLAKPVEGERLLEAVGCALHRSAQLRQISAAHALARARLETLTPREVEVMERVVGGLLNKQIADEIGAALRTVKIHRARVMGKMGVVSVPDLVRAAQAAGVPTAGGSVSPANLYPRASRNPAEPTLEPTSRT